MRPPILLENGFKDNPLLDQVEEFARREGAPVVAICAALEAQIADLPDEDKKIFLADMELEEPGLDRLIRAGYALLGLQTYFTAGPREVRAWTVRVGATAPQAAGVISHRLRARLHSRRGDFVCRLHCLQGRAGSEGSRKDAAGRQGIHSARRRCYIFQVQRLIRFLVVNGQSIAWFATPTYDKPAALEFEAIPPEISNDHLASKESKSLVITTWDGLGKSVF